MRCASLWIALALATSGVAAAEPAPDTSGVMALAVASGSGGRPGVIVLGGQPHTPSALDSIPHPWPGIATLLSATGTAVPIVLTLELDKRSRDSRRLMWMLAGEIITPSAGYFYGGIARNALPGLIVRGIGFGIAASAAGPLGFWSNETSGEFTTEHLVLFAGSLIVAAGAAGDILLVGDAVERNNEDRVRARLQTGLGVAPDGRTPLLSVTLRF